MSVTASTYYHGVVTTKNRYELPWTHASVVRYVCIAQIQPGSSILNLGCGNVVVALAAKDVLGPSHGDIVGIDKSHSMLQDARRLWEARSLPDVITLHCGDVTHLDAISSFHQASQSQTVVLTFDVVFARDLLSSIPDNEKQAGRNRVLP